VDEIEDTPEVRRQLSKAWRAAGNRMVEAGYSPTAVTETLLAVALASWSGLRSRDAAAERLREMADQLEQEQRNESGGEDRSPLVA
jgi:hypothetical protein